MSPSSEKHPIEKAVMAAFHPGPTTLESTRAEREAAPDDPPARARYFGHLARRMNPSKADPAHLEEALWWIRERPADLERVSVGFTQFMHAPFEEYSILRDALEHVVAAHAGDPSVLRAVGNLVQHHEPKRALTLLERAHELDPTDVRAAWWIGSHLARTREACTWHADAVGAREAARESLLWFERALVRATDGGARNWVLVPAAKAAFAAGDLDLARLRAEELVANARPLDDASGAPDGRAIHDGNVVLGRVALARGDQAAAVEHLARAGQSIGAPTLNSFGPELVLANELLQAGERAAVLAYLLDIGRFWKMEDGRLAHWRKLIEAGETPELSR